MKLIEYSGLFSDYIFLHANTFPLPNGGLDPSFDIESIGLYYLSVKDIILNETQRF